MFTQKSASLVLTLVCSSMIASCQSFRSSIGEDPNAKIEEVEGPMDGLPSIRFIYPAIIPPRVQAVEADTKLASSGVPLGDLVGKRGSKKAMHTVIGTNEFQVSLKGAEQAAVVQDGDNRCWAACVLMVSRITGFKLQSPRTGAEPTQSDLSANLNGTSRDEPAKLGVIIRALNPQLESKSIGQVVTVGAPIATQSTDRLLLDMCAGSPAIIGLDMGGFFHAYVVIGARYSWLDGGQANCRLKRFLNESQDSFGAAGLEWGRYLKDTANLANTMAVREVTVIDPADGRVRTLSGSELASRCRFIMTPRLGEEILTERYNMPLFDAGGVFDGQVKGLSNQVSDRRSTGFGGGLLGTLFGQGTN